jgi:hypothetical protein
MDVMTATAVQENSMTIFTIDSENNIAAHGSESEITDKAIERFTSEKELAALVADWPGTRLVDVWNGIPGLTRIKRFTNRPVAIARIWRAVQSLAAAESSGNVAHNHGASRKPTRKEHTRKGRKSTKQAQVLALLKRSGGATLQHLMRTTGWQAHSVRGFIFKPKRRSLPRTNASPAATPIGQPEQVFVEPAQLAV